MGRPQLKRDRSNRTVPGDRVPDDCFFIVGCQRSGTTLLRLVLDSHSGIHCYDEPASYGAVLGRPLPARARPLAGLKIPCLTEQLGRPWLWDQLLIPERPNVYRGQRVLFMVRDVRDTIVSMLALRHRGRPWIDTHLQPSLRSKVRREPAFRRRYEKALVELTRARHPRLARAAFYWQYKTDALFEYVERGFPVLPIRYENLVRQPETELQHVCEFLGVPWEPSLLRHDALAHAEVGADGLAIGGTDARRPIDTRSVDRWQGSFTGEQLEEILRFAGDPHARIYREAVAV